MNSKKILVFSFFSAFVALSSCSSKENRLSKEPTTAINVKVATPGSNDDNSIAASGQIEASKTAAISTRVMGRITAMNYNVGDRVSQGQVLATVSVEDIQAKKAQADAMIAEAEAHVLAAQKDYTRFSNLFKQESATAKELEMATLQYNAAKAKLEAARQMKNEVIAMMSYASLRAPFNGVITQKMAEAGNIANPGMPVYMLENCEEKQVTASVAEMDISKIKLGEPAMVTIKSTGRSFQGKVIQINPSSQFSGAQYIIKVSIPANEQKEALPGMYVNLSLASGIATTIKKQTDAVLIPVSAVVYKDELTGIYTLGNDNTALLRWIRLGKNYGDKVEVLSGLGKEERFILNADGKLMNGQKVTVTAP